MLPSIEVAVHGVKINKDLELYKHDVDICYKVQDHPGAKLVSCY